MAERIYVFESDCAMFADPGIEQMWKDGLGRFLVATWHMVAAKKGIRVAPLEE